MENNKPTTEQIQALATFAAANRATENVGVLTMTKKFKAGEKVRITYQCEEMEAVVIDHADNTRVWVRSHGGHGRALGYKAKDVRHA